MKRITEIEFVNYKAFYGNDVDNKISILNGKSVLIYGENGSGKSSIYEGLKQFFNSADNTIDTTPSRHIQVPKTRTEIEVTEGGNEISRELQNEVSVTVTFVDNAGSEQKIFGVPTNTTQEGGYIAQTNLLNCFLSYRELLRTYLIDNLRDLTEFRRNFASLLIENILAKQINTATQRSYISTWERLFAPYVSRTYKESRLSEINDGLIIDINRINLILNEILKYFEPNLKAKLILSPPYIDYIYSNKYERLGYYPVCEIGLQVKLFGIDTDNDEENHLTVLNEARLSALAISIYLAALMNTPQDDFDYKILFLDDIFIGLDMGNRLPLLEILKSYKKPIIVPSMNAENQLVEILQLNNGNIETEPHPFFQDYQIFISTYDRNWFLVAKKWLNTRSEGRWHYIEMFANKKNDLDFNTPIIYTSLDYLQKAEYYFSKHEYESCANHLRKALEQKIKELLPANEHYAEYLDAETGINELRKLKNLSQYLTKFINYCQTNGIDASELTDLNDLKDWYLNPFSHDNISTPIFKRELEKAIILVKQLQNFYFQILLLAGTNLYFNFDNGAGQTREYKIELQENLRYIISEGQNLLTNPLVRCYEWTQNGNVQEVSWAMELLRFYNNKWRALIQNPDAPIFPMDTYWNNLYQQINNEPLANLINQ